MSPTYLSLSPFAMFLELREWPDSLGGDKILAKTKFKLFYVHFAFPATRKSKDERRKFHEFALVIWLK